MDYALKTNHCMLATFMLLSYSPSNALDRTVLIAGNPLYTQARPTTLENNVAASTLKGEHEGQLFDHCSSVECPTNQSRCNNDLQGVSGSDSTGS